MSREASGNVVTIACQQHTTVNMIIAANKYLSYKSNKNTIQQLFYKKNDRKMNIKIDNH